ncbi:MAG: PKD domain-containing protein [Candidatus Hydrogenedens sp.]|nr:PKD domain-containing protein [Candidatus Hydrogenedens sp.]
MTATKGLGGMLAGLLALMGAGCAPTASFSTNPTGGNRPLTVEFEDTSATLAPLRISLNEIIPILSWNWDFGDETGSESQDPSHVYNVAGTYSVSLTVTNMFGSDTVTKSDLIKVQVPTTAPDSSFTFAVVDGDEFTVKFTDTSTPGSRPITAWQWDFGDGGGSTDSSPTHTFAAEGSYAVNLQVTTVVGTDSSEQTLTIPLTLPTANFTFERGNSELGVAFKDTSSPGGSPITQRKWNFGDGSILTVTGTGPNHLYTTAGTYDVTLEITTALGTDSVTKSVAVPQPE